jgi:hypothetical protein
MTVKSGLQQLLTTLDSQNRSRESSDRLYGESLYLFGLKFKMCNWCNFLEFGF